jgi:hypothetical protein
MKFTKTSKDVYLRIALDISASDTGIVVWRQSAGTREAQDMYIGHFKTPGSGDYQALLNVGRDIGDIIDNHLQTAEYAGVQVYPEQVFIGPHGAGMIKPLMMHGILMAIIHTVAADHHKDMWWTEVHVSTWRNWLLKAHAVKAASKKSKNLKAATLQIINKLGYETEDNSNIADAIGIMCWVTKVGETP